MLGKWTDMVHHIGSPQLCAATVGSYPQGNNDWHKQVRTIEKVSCGNVYHHRLQTHICKIYSPHSPLPKLRGNNLHSAKLSQGSNFIPKLCIHILASKWNLVQNPKWHLILLIITLPRLYHLNEHLRITECSFLTLFPSYQGYPAKIIQFQILCMQVMQSLLLFLRISVAIADGKLNASNPQTEIQVLL